MSEDPTRSPDHSLLLKSKMTGPGNSRRHGSLRQSSIGVDHRLYGSGTLVILESSLINIMDRNRNDQA